jgi:hypothetical protein
VRAVVGNLRIAVGRHPEDPPLAELIDELTVTQQTLALARSPEQSVVVCTTPAGSSSEHALALLRRQAADRHAHAASVRV